MGKRRFAHPWIVLALVCSASPGYGALQFNGIVFESGGHRSPDGPVEAGPTKAQGACLIESPGRITEAWKSRLESAGIHLEGYVAPNGYLIYVPEDVKSQELLQRREVGCVFSLLPDMKLGPLLHHGLEGDEVRLVVHLFRDATPDGIRKLAEEAGFEVTGTVERARVRAGVRCPAGRAREVARAIACLSETYFVELDHGIRLFNELAVPLLQSGDAYGPTPVWDQGICGSGEVIAVCDTGIDADSCFFRDPSGALPPVNEAGGIVVEATRRKVIAVDFIDSGENPSNPTDWDTQNHGTSVSGCALGSHIDSPTAAEVRNGLAPLAQLVMQDAGYAVDDCADLPGLGCPVIDLTPLFQQAYDQGARIHNNSWGDRENFHPHNTYTGRCQDIDDFSWSNRDFLGVFAAGNDGNTAGAVASPGVAKNAISVGGTRRGAEADQMADFSSWGFASDGRIKPDICAPGYAFTARNDGDVTTLNCSTAGNAGTSFASPYSAGCAALVRQYLREGFWRTGARDLEHGLSSPSGALVKAILINCAVDVTAAEDIPAQDQGWGRIQLDQALYFSGGSRALYLVEESYAFQSFDSPAYRLALLASPSQPLKVTLVWTDFPATLGSDPQIVNDLDLRVTMGSIEYLGNRFSGGYSVPGGAPDRLNNVEQVWISPIAGGRAEVRVHADSVPEPPQNFALVITGDFVVTERSGVGTWSVY